MSIRIYHYLLPRSYIIYHSVSQRCRRITVSLNFSLVSWKRQRFFNKILFIILILAVLAAIGTLIYVITTPTVRETFTEFYILGNEGKAEGYPNDLVVGKETNVIVGIINREHVTMSYHVEVRINKVKNNEWGPLVLDHDEKQEQIISFQIGIVGDNQKVEFLLYKRGQSEPHHSLHLLVNVRQ
ncbi:DUF1616 domain-containing protein [Chloroflexota bacterium]